MDPLGLVFALLVYLLSVYDSAWLLLIMPSSEFCCAIMSKPLSYTFWHHIFLSFFTQIRRLRIQQRIKNAELGISNEEPEGELPDFPSFIPFLPPLVSRPLPDPKLLCNSILILYTP